ncbi:hypothetical protein ACVWXO_005795 [Bradyrhizobium sp. LM2.7]
MTELAIGIDGAAASMASVVVPPNAMVAKDKALLAATHLFPREERLHQPRFSRSHLQEFDQRFAIPGRRSKNRQCASFSLDLQSRSSQDWQPPSQIF